MLERVDTEIDSDWSIFIMQPQFYPGEYKVKLESEYESGFAEFKVIEPIEGENTKVN